MSKIKRVFWDIFNKLAKATSLVKLKIVCLGVCVCVWGGGGGGQPSLKKFWQGFSTTYENIPEGWVGIALL